MKNDNYIVVQGWMVNELHLKGNELLVYAIIYGFSQDGEGRFTGSLQYLADWTNATKQGVMKNLKSLCEKKYICKEEKIINGVKFVKYYATELTWVSNKVDRGIEQSSTGGIKQSLPNNKDKDKKEHNKRNIFVPPTIQEVADYCSERNNNVNPEKFVSYYESNGWMVGRNKMKDWKAAVRTWEQNQTNRKPDRGYTNKKAEELDGFYDMVSDWAKK